MRGLGRGDDELFEGADLDGDEEDEETIRLELEVMEARLKLKRLQAAKAQKKRAPPLASGTGAGAGDGGGMSSVPIQSKLAAVRDRIDRQQQAARDVQVPASPVKRTQSTADLQTSPQRVLLGIDKGLRGADVSLKRAPGLRAAANEGRQVQQGGWLRRSESRIDIQAQPEPRQPLSFNERLVSARTEEVTRREKREAAQKQRSTAFSVDKEEMEGYKTKALDLPDLPSKPQEFSRAEILASIGRPLGGQLQRSSTVPNAGPGAKIGDSGDDPFSQGTGSPGSGAFEPYSGLHLSKRILPHNVLARAVSGKKAYLLKDLLRQVKAPEWSLPDDEPDIVVFAIVGSKSDPRSHRPGPGNDSKAQQDRGKYMVITLVDLTYEVELFLFNSGFDRFWKLTPGTVLAILNPGILPPPPGREATNRFGLVINSDEDTILEIGNARDVGYCKSIKKDGTYCQSWVNARRTEYCEFHTNEAVRKARSSRIEMSTTAGFGSDGPRGRNNSRQAHHKSEEELKLGRYDRATQSQYFISTAHRTTDPDDEQITGMADRKEREAGLKRRLAQKEKERDIARRLGEVGAGAGKDYMTRAASRATTTNSRPTLGSSFSSAATSSFSSAAPTSATTSASSLGTTTSTAFGERPKWDARALGLVGRRGDDQPKIHLGPAPTKRKRPESSGSSTVSNMPPASNNNTTNNNNTKTPLGWGTTLKSKLGRMKEGERLDGRTITTTTTTSSSYSTSMTGTATTTTAGDPLPPVLIAAGGAAARRGERSPVRKKTRFVTEKGIREAGRESLGEPLSAAVKTRRQVVLDDDDDDDDLIIVG